MKVRVRRGELPPDEAIIANSLVSRVHIPHVQPGRVVPVVVDPRNPARVTLGIYKY